MSESIDIKTDLKIMEEDIKHEDIDNLDNDMLEVEEVEEVVENSAPVNDNGIQGGKGKCRRV